MQQWQKKKGFMRAPRYVTVLEPIEREALGNLASSVAEALIARVRSAPKDELAELTGLPGGHKEAPSDPGLARLLPDFQKPGDEEFDGDNAMLRQFNETDICRQKIINLQVVIEAMGPDGGVKVELDEDEAKQWLAAINDLRLYVAAKAEPFGMGLSDPDGDHRMDPRALVDHTGALPEGKADLLVNWLAYNQESLLEVLFNPEAE